MSLAPPDVASDVKSAGQRQHLGLALAVICAAQLMVVLDATIVNIALPTIQTKLGFSSANLQWVLNAYMLAFGGLLLLGGRAGDLLGRRRMFIVGVLLFAGASLVGGLATDPAMLLTARVVQGVGGAIASPTALALISTTFPEGKQRNSAMGVYAAMSGSGAAIGLLLGGLLTQYASWRWVFFVNVPIGLLTALLAMRVLPVGERIRGKLDLPGAITVTGGMTLLVYGLTRGPQNGWANAITVGCLIGAVVLLAAFIAIEARSPHALAPLRIFANRARSGSYIVAWCLGAAMMGLFFFLVLFVQDQLHYSAIKSGLAFLPVTVGIVVAAGVAAQLMPRVGPRALLGAGLLITAVSMFWLAQINEHTKYASGLLAPSVVMAIGMGLAFVPLMLTGVSGVKDTDQGLASALVNTGQQVGGARGRGILATG
jgi:EmrB/QacA subfamily drug resistance transporter